MSLIKRLKQSKNELKEADLDRQLKELNQELGKSSRELSSDAGKVRDTTAQPAARTGHIIPHMVDVARNSHKGHSKFVAWIKTKYGSRYRAISNPCRQKLVLEHISYNACCDLPEKIKDFLLTFKKPEL